MKKLNKIANRLASIDINLLVKEVLSENEHILIDMNVLQLKEKGVYSTGELISNVLPYAKPTIFIKRDKGTLTNNNPSIVNLYDEGDFHEGFFVEFDDKGITFNSSDEKTSELIYKYGEEIFSLIDENQNELLIYYLKPGVSNLLKNAVNA